jgi:hypothetical protein
VTKTLVNGVLVRVRSSRVNAAASVPESVSDSEPRARRHPCVAEPENRAVLNPAPARTSCSFCLNFCDRRKSSPPSVAVVVPGPLKRFTENPMNGVTLRPGSSSRSASSA